MPLRRLNDTELVEHGDIVSIVDYKGLTYEHKALPDEIGKPAEHYAFRGYHDFEPQFHKLELLIDELLLTSNRDHNGEATDVTKFYSKIDNHKGVFAKVQLGDNPFKQYEVRYCFDLTMCYVTYDEAVYAIRSHFFVWIRQNFNYPLWEN